MSKVASVFLAVLLLFASRAYAEGEKVYRQANGDYKLTYPRDHGAHPDYETEWWYVTGHLTSDAGRTFGFELVFFRIGVDQDPASRSEWKMDSFHFAHFAFTDDQRQQFKHFVRTSRGNFQQAGASTDRLNVWLRDWKLEMKEDSIELAAAEEGIQLKLTLSPKKPLALHGENGLSRKGPGPGDASYYTSYTRLEGSGALHLSGEQIPIAKASAWLDQEFTSSTLARGTEGWDWFALQLDNGEEVMAYLLRKANGEPSEFSSGSWIKKDGAVIHLTREEFQVEPLASWTSPNTGIAYPAKWKIQIPGQSFVATVTPTVSDQELVTGSATGVTYWEGRCRVDGEIGAQPVSGNAYTELVGYKKQ